MNASEFLRWAATEGSYIYRDAQHVLDQNGAVTSVHVAFAERLALATLLAAHADGSPTMCAVEWYGLDQEEARQASAAWFEVLLGATVFVWTNDMRRAAGGANTIGDFHRMFVGTDPWLNLPQKACWFTWETDIDLDGTAESDYVGIGAAGLGKLLLQREAGSTVVLDIMKKEDGTVVITGGIAPPNRGPVPQRDDGMIEAGWANYYSVAALLAFLESPYIPKEDLRLDRGARRRLQHANAPWADDTVTFVALRRGATQATGGEGGTERLYHWRWLVSGHFRRQWYPGSNQHKVIWVPPHVKGPEGAPMKPRVYRVSR